MRYRRRTSWESLTRTEQIREHPQRSGHARGKLAEPRKRREHIDALSVPSHQRSAEQRLLAGVMSLKQRLVMRIELRGEVQTSLLHPAVEVRRGDLVRPMEQR